MHVKIIDELWDGTRVIRWHIERPDRLNAIGTAVAAELSAALDSLQKGDGPLVRALILSAQTVITPRRNIWIAGGDLKELASLPDRDSAEAYARVMRQVCMGLETLPFPVISFVDGAALGGGAELAIAADIRLGTAEAAFEWKQLNLGLCTGYGATGRLCDLIGKAKAQRLLFFAETVSAVEALSLGLLHRIIGGWDDVIPEVRKLAALDPTALAAQKRLLGHSTTVAAEDQAKADNIFKDAWRNPGHHQALTQFANKVAKKL